jgi:hypothetical protein
VVTGTGSDCGSGGGVFPFAADNNYNQVVYSTSTPTLWFKSGLFASSTSFLNALTLTTPLTTANGGTGLSNPGSGGANVLLQFAGAGGASTVAPGAQYTTLQSTSGGGGFGVDAVPLDQSAAITGILPYGNGGTGTSTAQISRLLYGGTTAYQSVATSSIGAGTGLSFSGTAGAQVGGTNGTYSVNTSQNISTLSNLTTNGFVQTSGGTGALGVQVFPCTIAQGCTATTTGGVTNGVYFWNGSTYTNDAALIHLPSAATGIGTTSPWAQLSISTTTASAPTTPLFAVGSSTNATLFAINGAGQISLIEDQPGTTTTIILDWTKEPQQVNYRIGTAAVSITVINATTTQYDASTKRVWVCNPNASAGALTWVGVEWFGSAPTQTTTANQCDQWILNVAVATSSLTSSPTFKVFGGANLGAK